jgi:hypothetical protein
MLALGQRVYRWRGSASCQTSYNNTITIQYSPLLAFKVFVDRSSQMSPSALVRKVAELSPYCSHWPRI